MVRTKSISAETVNKNRDKWYLTYNQRVAKNYAGTTKQTYRLQIYRLPNGIYAIRKKLKKKY